MREIKFRVWNIDEYISLNEAMHSDIVYIQAPSSSKKSLIEINWEGVELEQFTGMHDKNGVPIYEGDVVSVFCDDEFVFNHAVLFDPEVCAYVIDVSCCDYDTTTMIWAKQMNYYEYEVIGNIHQHAHLLEQSKC